MANVRKNDTEFIKQAKELWQLTLRRKWIVVTAGVLLSATAVVVVAMMPNWYSASITISVDPQKMPDRYVSSSVMMDQLRFDTLSEQVLSTPRLQQIMDEFHLYPELRDCRTQQEIIDYMRKNITVQIKQGGDRNLSAFTIKFVDKNRDLVAPVTSRLADSFIQWDLATREHQATGASDFLATQLQEAKKELDGHENKINVFRERHLGELPEQSGVNSAALSRLQTNLQANIDNLNRLEQEKILLAESQSNGPATPTQRDRLEEQKHKIEDELADLRSHYSDEYPDVQQAMERLAAVRQKIANLPPDPVSISTPKSPASARLVVTNNEIKRLQGEQTDILAQIKQYQSKVDAAPLHEQELADLERDYQTSKLHYQSLLDKTFSADMAQDMERKHEADRFSVLEPAMVPEKPFKPHRTRMVLILVPLCFLFSAALVIVTDLVVRGTINSERALRALLPASVQIVGRIPDIDTPQTAKRQRKFAAIAITGSLICCLLAAFFVWKLHAPI